MFIAALFTIAKHENNLNVHRQMTGQRRCGVYITEYYSTIKRNEIMPFAATQIQVEIIILSEVSQKEKDKYHMMSFTRAI